MSELEDFLAKRIEYLEQELTNEREKSHQLTLLLLENKGELEQKQVVAESIHGYGKLKWPDLKDRLENKFKKKLSSIEEVNNENG